MSRRNLLAVVLGLGAAALFARLGVWQLHRLAERRAFNARLESRLRNAPVPLAQLPADSAEAHYRMVRVDGTFDFDHQIVLTGRSHQGSPGVYIFTPLRPRDGGRAVLVNRGWVYSPDASTVDFGKWDEPPTTTVQGYVEEFASRGRGPAQVGTDSRSWRWLDGSRLARAFPYPIEPYYVVALANGQRRPDQTARLELPAMDDGPHKNYAIQWFSFAAIAVVGVGTLIWTERGPRPQRTNPTADDHGFRG